MDSPTSDREDSSEASVGSSGGAAELRDTGSSDQAPCRSLLEAQLLDLGDDLLETVLLNLGLRDRVRAAGACRRLQALSRASARLWASARLSLVGVADAERCAAWLAARRALLRRLWLAGPRPAPSQRYRGFHGSREVSRRVDHVMSEAERLEAADAALLEALRGAPLSALHREAATPLRLGADLSPWRQLRWLSLAAPHISLPADLAWQLPALTTLHLRCNSPPLELLPDRLPPGLLELRFHAQLDVRPGPAGPAAHLPSAIAEALPQLTRLELQPPGPGEAAVDMSWLPACRSLRVLALHCGECTSLGPIPPDLSALSQLEVLDLCGSRLRPAAQDRARQGPPVGWLAQLCGLRQLGLAGCRLRWVPQEAMELPRLEVLHIQDNPLQLGMFAAYDDSLLAGPALCTLRELGLDMVVARLAMHALRGMSELRVLHLYGASRLQPTALYWSLHGAYGFAERGMLVEGCADRDRLGEGFAMRGMLVDAQVARNLARPPRLERVTYDDSKMYPAALTGSRLPVDWLAALRRECVIRGLALARQEGRALPGLATLNPWD